MSVTDWEMRSNDNQFWGILKSINERNRLGNALKRQQGVNYKEVGIRA